MKKEIVKIPTDHDNSFSSKESQPVINERAEIEESETPIPKEDQILQPLTTNKNYKTMTTRINFR